MSLSEHTPNPTLEHRGLFSLELCPQHMGYLHDFVSGAGGDRGCEWHNSLLESFLELASFLWNSDCTSWLSHGRSCRLNKSKPRYLHSFQTLATGDTAALHLQLCIQPLQLVSHGKQQTPSKAACSNIRTKTGPLLLLLYFDYIKCTPVTAFFLWVQDPRVTHITTKTTLPVLHKTLDIHFSAHLPSLLQHPPT